MAIRVIKNQKGGENLLVDGFMYQKKGQPTINRCGAVQIGVAGRQEKPFLIMLKISRVLF